MKKQRVNEKWRRKEEKCFQQIASRVSRLLKSEGEDAVIEYMEELRKKGIIRKWQLHITIYGQVLSIVGDFGRYQFVVGEIGDGGVRSS